jgi:peptidoglycan/xylan/chitin deacetylase (PgdA/CDA1 family)
MLAAVTRLLFLRSMFRQAALALVASVAIAAPVKTAADAALPVAGKGAAPAAPVTATAAVAAKKITFSQCHVEGPYIAMTFDDGPSAANTPRLLKALRERGIKATFFVCGNCVAENPEIAKQIVTEGHEIANHSWNHPQLSTMTLDAVRDQIQRTHDVVKQTTGVNMTLLRPPYGAFTAMQRNWANSTWGYKIILWDVDPLDWKVRNAAHVETEILKQTVQGSIVLSHDIHKTTVDAMPATLDALAAKGFKFVTVSELLAMDKPVAPKAAAGKKAAPAPAEDGKPLYGSGSETPEAAAPAKPAAKP